MSTYSGRLQPKRKSELQEISRALGLRIPDDARKDEFEDGIAQALTSNDKLRNDSRFSALRWSAMKSHAADKASKAASRVVDDATAEANRAVAVVNKESAKAVTAFEQTQLYGAVTKFSKDVRVSSAHFAAAAQHELSQAWLIVGLTVWLELAFVLLTHTHYHEKYSIGPFKWAPFPLLGQTAYTVTLPHATIWWRGAFLRPFGLWVLATVVAPLVAAVGIVFPRPEVHSRRSSRRHGRPEPPSPVTFSIARLAISYFLLKVAPVGLMSDWRFIAQFADLQLLAASVGLAFSVYEALAA